MDEKEWNFKYFKKSEFACKCGCGLDDINYSLVFKLDKIREKIGLPIIINSGCRCSKHNKEVGGKPDSAHLRGLAADIKCEESWKRLVILRGVIPFFSRVGISNHFIHVDIDGSKPPALWIYPY